MGRWAPVSHPQHALFALLFWIITTTAAKKSDTYYMDGSRCDDGRTKSLGGAVVYSHYGMKYQNTYTHNMDCRMTFQARHPDWKLMMRIEQLDIPDKSYTELCNDALYVYDANNIFGRAMKQAGGTGGLCGRELPPIIYSSGAYLTVYFRTDPSGPTGTGFKFVLTAYTDAHDTDGGCGSDFECTSSHRCIDRELTCDDVDHCGDRSDEQKEGGANCNNIDSGLITRFLSLGITAAIAITVGSIVVFITCIVCIICCCCRCMKKRDQDPGGGSPGPCTTTATSVTINNGGPIGPAPYQHGFPPHQGYYPMHALPPQPAHPASQSMTYSPYPPCRESAAYSHPHTHSHPGSAYSSQPPPSYHRSYTPTSSRSGKSLHSGGSNVKQGQPIHL